MKISENWLREWVNPKINAAQIGEQLTMAGLELDGLSKVAKDFSGVVVGEVKALAPHPDADRLKIASVAIDDSQPLLQIVCGASNVAVGIKVPVATIGAVLPANDKADGDKTAGKPFVIKKGKLRGVVSEGMLCGGAEIDLDDGVDGLLILPDDAPVGENLRTYLGLDSHILDIAITPNRGDCLSVQGVARELAVLNELPFALPFDGTASAITTQASQPITVATEACPRYLAQVVTGLNNILTPPMIQNKLIASGIRPKNLLVDVTNYVLIELGQPLHAFDKAKIVGTITVRIAKQGETLQLLNEQTITFTGDELVIADDEGVIALAGIMGGLRTAVSDSTTEIVLESAFFDPLAIAGRARRFGLHTDASQRFERGVDFELPSLALNRAVNLLVQYGDGQVGQISQHDNQAALPVRANIALPFAKIAEKLGISLDQKTVLTILNQLHIQALIDKNDDGDVLVATAPSHRFDIAIGEDLIEEIARIYGYNNIDNRLPSFAVNLSDDREQVLIKTLKNRLVNAGYFEAISFSFSDEKVDSLFGDSPKPLALANPISSELGVMRRTLLSSLLPCVQYNLNRQTSRVRLFETGLRFVGEMVATLEQIPTLALVATGERDDKAISGAVMDFYAFKADVERLLSPYSNNGTLSYQRSDEVFLHTGQGADVYWQSKKIGWFGQLHPKIADTLGLPTTWVAQFDIQALLLLHSTWSDIKAPSKFPKVRRDFAFLVDNDLPWQEIEQVLRQQAGVLMSDCWLFDVYVGDKLPVGKKSLAFAVVWQDSEGTLPDARIKALSDAIISQLTAQFGAKLRDGE